MAELLTTPEAAKELGRRPATLRSWRARGIGPAYYQPGGPGSTALYTEEDLAKFKQTLDRENH